MPSVMFRVLWVFALVLLLVVVLYFPAEIIHQSNSDETYYLNYAGVVAKNGLYGYRQIVDWYAQSEINRYHPSPARPAYIFLAALLVKVFGESYAVLVCLSYVSYLAFCAVSFYYALKLFSGDFAICLLLILSSSPLILGMSRVALTDSLLNLFWGCSVWAFMDFLNKRSAAKLAALVAFLTLSLLVKEASVLLLVFIAVFSSCFARYFKLRVAPGDVAAICVVPVVLAAVVYWIVLGGYGSMAVLVKSIYLTHFVDRANPYALLYSSGPWFRYFVDFMMVSPVITLAGLGYAGSLILKRSRDWKKMFFLVYFVMIYVPLSFLQHTKVLRFVINLEMVLAFFCVCAVLDFFKNDIREGRWGSSGLTLTVIAVVSTNLFYDTFVYYSLLDPITFNFMRIQRFIPGND